MRFVKGTITPSAKQDFPLMELIMNNGILTKKQLVSLININDDVGKGSLNWRLRRLVQGGLLNKILVGGNLMIHGFSITEKGLDVLAMGGVEVRSSSLLVCDVADPKLFHTVIVNDIQEAFLKHPAFQSWETEIVLSEKFNTGISGYGKVYDGICELAIPTGRVQVAIEYERSLKNAREYSAIRSAFEADKKVGKFLYITNDSNTMMSVRQHFVGTTAEVYFGLLKNVLPKNMDEPPAIVVADVNTCEAKPLIEHLSI